MPENVGILFGSKTQFVYNAEKDVTSTLKGAEVVTASKKAKNLTLATDDIAKSIRIPACPEMLISLQHEMAQDDPDPKKVAAIIRRDVAMSATLLKTANSAYFKLMRKVDTVELALAYIGMKQCGSIMMGLIARKALKSEGAAHAQFWNISGKRALAMSVLAKRLRVATPDVAHTFGLFCDIGIPLLLERFPDYHETLKIANGSPDERFTSIEDARHQTCHATIGPILAKSWGLAPDIGLAIRLHHEYEIIGDPHISEAVKGLVSLGIVVERTIQTYRLQTNHAEWEKGGSLAMTALGISDDEMADICDDIHQRFDANI